MQQDLHAAEILGRTDLVEQITRADGHDPAPLEHARIELVVDLVGNDDGDIHPLVEAGDPIRARVDIDEQVGVTGAQMGKCGHQPLRREQRRHGDADAHPRALPDPLDSRSQRLDLRLDIREEGPTALVQLDRVVVPLKKGRPDELFERLDSPRQRRRG
jgi:hypothetical protein